MFGINRGRKIFFILLLQLFFFVGVHADVIPYTPSVDGITYHSSSSLARINDGNIATNTSNDFQVHPTNAVGRTITMTFNSPVAIANAEFHNRTGCCRDRIAGAEMIFKDSGGTVLHTYTFPGTYSSNTTPFTNPNLITIIPPSILSGVKTVELTNFQGSNQNFREIIFNGPDTPAGIAGGLTLWLDADDSATLFQDKACSSAAVDSDTIGCWLDKSGQANHVSVVNDGAREPIYNINQLNAKPTLDFANDSLVTPDGDQITSNTSYTKIAVVKYDGNGSNNIISSGTAGGGHAFWGAGGTQIAMWHGGTFANSSNLGTTNYQIGVGRYAAPDSLTSVINVNGSQLDSDTVLRNFTATAPTRIGSHGESNFLNGQIAEIIVYDRALLDTEIDNVECYLAEKWDITVNHCSSLKGPGGVKNGLTTWIKADSGVTGNPVTSWDAFSGDAASPTVVGTPDFETESINFNPALSFQGTSSLEYINFGNIANNWTQAQAFMVAAQQNENITNANETGTWRIGGNSNSHVTWTNELIYESFGNSSRINALATPYSTHIPHLYSASQSSSNQANLYWNGENIHNSVRSSFFGTQPVWLARGRWGGRYLGDIPEFVLYDAPLSILEQQRVDSYLALKYGLTLDQTTPLDYLASDGVTKMWDKDISTASTYNNNITGIGRDDASDLGQIKSRSSNSDSIVIIQAEGEGTNLVNTFSDIDDLEFLTWAHDNGDITTANIELPVGIPAAATGRIAREWQVQREGDLGTVTVSFDLGNQLVLDIAVASDYALLLDSDGDFSNAAVYTIGANISGNEISFTGVNLTDGIYFTLAGPPKPAPGGVGATLWLKANEGTDTVVEDSEITTWSDQAGSNDAISVGTGRPTYQNEIADQLNFNPTLRFDGVDDYLGITRNFPETDYTQLMVYKTTDPSGTLSTIVSPTSPTAGSHDRNFSIVAGGLSHRLWNSNQVITSTQDFNDETAHIGSITVDSTVGQTLHSDGGQVAFGNRTLSNFTWQTGMVIGRHSYRGALEGDIAELIFVDNSLDTTNRNKVESYLALKYGITLDQTTSTDYRSSNETIIFDATTAMAGYENDIAGIGQDDGSDLDQTISRSQNEDAIVTIGNASSQDNNDFLMWGNNSGSLSQVTNNLPTGPGSPVSRLDRTWKIQETGDIGNVNVSIDISSLGIVSTGPAKLGLIIDNDTDFTSGSTVEIGDALVNGVVTFNAVDFTSGDYFTLGVIPVNIGDKIWNDIDGNGTQSGALEIGISDVTVALYHDDGGSVGTFDGDETLVGIATTSANGDYDFTGLDDGDYWIDITDTNGWLVGAVQTGGNGEPERIQTVAGDDYNDADYGYQMNPPILTDANISVNAGSGTDDTFIVGDTLIVTWNASITGDTQIHPLRTIITDLSTLGGGSATAMTDTTACGGTAGDDIYEACITYTAGIVDTDNVNPTITVSNAGATTGPISDSTNSNVDNQPPVFVTSGLSIQTDNGALDIAGVNGAGVDADTVTVNATLAVSDSDTISWNASSIGGSAIQGNNTSVTLSAGSFGDLATIFDISVTDNAGNTLTLDTDEIDNTTVSIDTGIPVISLTGSGVIDLEIGDSYLELGAIFTDNVEGTGSTIVGGDTVITTGAGTFTIDYDYTDGAGNVATTVKRTVNVKDSIPPVITLNGSGSITIEAGSIYTELGATWSDNIDGTGSALVGGNSVLTSATGSYTVNYDYTDAAGNAATQVNRTVNVIDTIVPTISLTGSGIITIQAGSTYTDLGATWSDNLDGTGSLIATGGPVITTGTGSFTLNYNYTDTSGNSATQITRTVHVIDTTNPTISLTGSGVITLETGDSYTDAGAIWSDNLDGTGSIVSTGGPVTTVGTGSFILNYNYTDASGNIAPQVSRTVNIVDTIEPSLVPGSLTAITTSSGATITWQTNEPTSSEIIYGLTTITDTSTGEQDVAPRVINHSLILDDLRACTSYHYIIISRDASLNELRDGTHTFITDGCAGGSSIEQELSSNIIPTEVGATGTEVLTLGTGSNLLEVEVPVGYFDTGSGSCAGDGAFFQLKELQGSSVITTLGTPGIHPISLKTYDLSAYCNTSEQVEEFDEDISITISYDNDEVTLFNEEDIRIFRYDTDISVWTPLSNCSVNLGENNVTCATRHFSTFGAFTIVSDPRKIGGGRSINACRDPLASNYKTSGNSDDSLCIFDEPALENLEEPVIPSKGEGELSESEGILEEIEEVVEENLEQTETIIPEIEISEPVLENIPKQILQKEGKEYSLSEDYSNCAIVRDINDGDYIYDSSGVFSDEHLMTHTGAILKFAEIGILNGYADATFSPKSNITRTEFLKVVLQSHCMDYNNQDTSGLDYIDIDKNSWQARVVSRAKEEGIINGDILSYDKELIDKNLGKQYSFERIEELKRVFTFLGLYDGEIDGYYTDDFVDAVYDFQFQQKIMNTPYDQGAGFWGAGTREAFFSIYPESSYTVFRPNDIISKAEATKILMKMANAQATNPDDLAYDDITTPWHIPYIRSGQTLGLFDSDSDDRVFAPDSGVSREDMVYLVTKLVGLYK